jgi:hypothetical protein
LDVLAHGSLQLPAAVFTAGAEIEVIPLLSSGRRVRGCDSNRNCSSGAHELDLNHCALDAGEIHTWHSFRSKTKTLMLLGDSPETPGTRVRIVLLHQSSPSPLVFHVNLPLNKKIKSDK